MTKRNHDEIEAEIDKGKASGDAQESLTWYEVESVLNSNDHERYTASDIRRTVSAMDRLIASARLARTKLRRLI